MNVVMNSTVKFSTLLLALTFLGSGCSGRDVNESDPKSIYEDALIDADDGLYVLSLNKLRKVKSKFPYSKYATLAKLKIADVYYLQEAFMEAAAAYETFIDLHPKHEKASYALFRVAESYFNDAPKAVPRDLTSAKSALTAYRNYLSRFPKGPESQAARNRVQEILNLLAQKELYIGNYYYGQSQFESALGRYEAILQFYPETEAAKEAGEKLKRTKAKIEAEKKS